ncbi:uncharacterized protein LOC111211463 [Brassica napus]|uniref:uncharacterized protein LOC111211463 n=1 Tax=Brassica napus TaxID=3708 RepID=UPI002078DA33|nr:uncharacterized protein LOC111211463 [Brassica napus]
MVIRKKLPPRRGRCREPQPQPVAIRSAVFTGYDGDECEPVPGDDCEAIVDDPGDEIEEYENEVSEEEGCGVQTEEEACEVFSSHFGDVASNDGDENDESGDYDCWNEDNTPDPVSSDDEEEDAGMRIIRLFLYQLMTRKKMREGKLVRMQHQPMRYDIKLYISTQIKIGAVCSDTEYDCPWRVYCSFEKRKHKLQIKVYLNEHACIRSGYSKMLKPSSIAQLFAERLRVNPKLTAKEIAEEIKRTYNLIVTEDQCQKAKTKVTRERRASHEKHFSRIWDYEAELRKTNPGTITEIVTIPGQTPRSKQRFERIYICFEAQRAAWKSTCRPIIGLDGAFLKWDVKGQLIAAMGRDGDCRIVPIAWAVVEIENDINWAWFVNYLKVDLQLSDGSNLTFISDKQKGLVKAVHLELPNAEHRMCARHILGNWKRDSHDPQLERLVLEIARSYTLGDFIEHTNALKSYNQLAHQTLQATNPHTWSGAYFKVGSCCNDNLNNLNESFNKTICEAMRKPLLGMLEDIRRKCMVRTTKRSIIANRLKTRYTKRAHIAIETAIAKSQDCIRYMATGDVYEIDYHNCSYSVDMGLKTCGCGMWQLNGIPRNHAACVITAKKQKIVDYVSDYYTTIRWRKTYDCSIRPVEGMKLWPMLNRLPVLPPPNRLGNRGRPSTYARRKIANESSSSSSKTKLSREKRVMIFSNCREEGHTKPRCSKPSVPPEPKRPSGRPKNDQGGSQGGSQIGS